ncbi:putative GNAT family acetyltransferase [Crossiella equi]|uniref:GNAT family acetyltransferase n=1 Tax=Crossiella equi TaxID=130796 RepID=A0ABS5AC37_9PSEU|nr:GNAT family N-acetyltransferase [Crossiella equi]MBP2473862.1 putative GNAT family acetyltransferase [Crossiella equi]
MDARVHTDIQEFWDLAGPLFLSDPVRHTVAVTVLRRCLAGVEADYRNPVLVTVHDHTGAVVGATARTPPYGLIVSALPPDTAPAAVEALRQHDPELPGVNGPRDNAEPFGKAWAAATGKIAYEHKPMRAYRLGELVPPTVAGSPRLGTEADLELLVAWREAFHLEATGRATTDERAAVLAGLASGAGTYVLWEVHGAPVALAHFSGPTAGMSRIGPVYTPEHLRGNGYASAATAEASRVALARGATDVVLFTDLGNEVANRIYQRIGYRADYEVVEIDFREV